MTYDPSRSADNQENAAPRDRERQNKVDGCRMVFDECLMAIMESSFLESSSHRRTSGPVSALPLDALPDADEPFALHNEVQGRGDDAGKRAYQEAWSVVGPAPDEQPGTLPI